MSCLVKENISTNVYVSLLLDVLRHYRCTEVQIALLNGVSLCSWGSESPDLVSELHQGQMVYLLYANDGQCVIITAHDILN